MPTEDEVEINKLHLRLANRRSQAKSWLSAYGADEDEPSNPSAETSIQTDFGKNSDELAGIGATSSEADDVLTDDRRMLQVNADLRRRLLTREAKDRYARQSKSGPNGARLQVETRKKPQAQDSSDDEDEGRSGLGKGRKRVSGNVRKDSTEGGVELHGQAEAPSQSKRKRATNYLDQVLAQRQQKRNKKSAKEG